MTNQTLTSRKQIISNFNYNNPHKPNGKSNQYKTLAHMNTVRVKIKGTYVNVLLDQGSTHTTISKSLQDKLKIPSRGRTILELETLAVSTKYPSEQFSLIVPTRKGSVKIKGYVMKENMANIEQTRDIDFDTMWPALDENIKADLLLNNFTGQVDIIIGQDNLWRLVLDKIIVHPSEDFGIIKTKMGWSMGGAVRVINPTKWQRGLPTEIDVYKTNIKIETDENKEIERSIAKMFEKEEEEETGTYTVEEQFAVDSFNKNVKQEKDGRYTVNPLFKQTCVPIKNNYFHALKRYRGLRNGLGRDEIKNKIYNDAINQMIQNGEVEEVTRQPQIDKNMDACINYPPHHGVFKLDRISTKSRIVFYASAKTLKEFL